MEELKTHGDYSKVHSQISFEFVSQFERMVRALCRLFRLGPLGKEAGIYTGYISPFLFLMDKELGKPKYSINENV